MDFWKLLGMKALAGGSGGSSKDVRYVTFMSEDGATTLYVKPVATGDDCVDVVAKGLIDAPTKESTEQYNYTHSGWSLAAGGAASDTALSAVTEDRTVYAAYTASTRYYTVRFFDGETLLNTAQVEYGGSASYTATKDGYGFDGWLPSSENITADTDCYAQWETAITLANATWAQIAEISEAGNAEQYFSIGDTKEIFVNSAFPCVVEIVGFNHDPLTSDTTKTAGISFLCKTVPAYMTISATSGYSSWSSVAYMKSFGWKDTPFAEKTWCNDTLYASLLPSDLKAVIKQVQKKCHKYTRYANNNGMTDSFYTTTSDDYCWIPSVWEIGATETTDVFDTASIGSNSSSTTVDTPADGTCYERFADVSTLDAAAYHAAVPVYIHGTTTEPEYHIVRTHANAVRRGYLTASGATQTASGYEVYPRFGFCV